MPRAAKLYLLGLVIIGTIIAYTKGAYAFGDYIGSLLVYGVAFVGLIVAAMFVLWCFRKPNPRT